MTTIAYFDCFSGISGDMVLGALLDAGLSLDALIAGLRDGLPALTGYRLEVERVNQHGITGSRLSVVLDGGVEQSQRDWREIRALLTESGLPPVARATALAIFGALAAAEARVHGTTEDEVHFHEVGAVDSIVDIAGAALGLHLLDVERIYCSPLSDGRGFTRSRHGVIPVPAPATAALLAAAEAPTREAPTDKELVTPTGAAIVAALAEFSRPAFQPRAIGYGYGRRALPWPNALRIWLGRMRNAECGVRNKDEGAGKRERGTRNRTIGEWGVGNKAEDGAEEPERDEALLLETNIDDMNPQFYAPLLDRLFEAGALDGWLTPIVMKKGRPAVQVSVLAPPAEAQALTALLIEHTSTLGVRTSPVARTKAGRRIEEVTTPWGPARVKLKVWRGRVVGVAPEYDDCAALALAAGLPIATVHASVARLGEAYLTTQGGRHESS